LSSAAHGETRVVRRARVGMVGRTRIGFLVDDDGRLLPV
jgi:hypothetical protein